MKWIIDYLAGEGIVYAKTSGVLDVESHGKFTEEMVAIARKHGCHKFLTDHRDTQGHFSILEVDNMNLPERITQLGIGPEDKIATLPNPDWVKECGFSFFKNLAQIRSIRFAFFSDKAEAIEWLKSE
ncbi:MAG: hypothetical protein WC476_05135 [Phycisphaerae bacterium]|jgi:hypothetical protein